MSLVQKLKDAFTKTGEISKLNEAFTEENIFLPIGIKMHYAGIDGVDEERIVIRKFQNGAAGEVLATAEYVQPDDTWYISHPKTGEVATVSGKDNHSELAHEINEYLQRLVE